MTQKVTATSSVDLNVQVSEADRLAALRAGYCAPYITDEEKFAQAERERLARGEAPVVLLQPTYQQAATATPTSTKTSLRTAFYRQYIEPIVLSVQMAFHP